MSSALRVSSWALGLSLTVNAPYVQAAELPPIFAPRPETAPALAPISPTMSSPVSTRVRSLVAEKVQAAMALLPPPKARDGEADAEAKPTVTSEGALLMQRFVVRSVLPRPDEIVPPELPVMRFELTERVDRRVKPGWEAPLMWFSGGVGSVNFGVVNGAGQGLDHGRDFTRVELSVKIRF